MSQKKILLERLQEVFIDGHWIANTNYNEILHTIHWETAIEKIESLNTIAHLTFHINYYLEGLIVVFQGGELTIRDQFSFDLPPIQSEQDWNQLVNRLIQNAKSFIDEIQQIPESKLSEPFVKPQYGTYQRNIEGVIEHSYYHLGQISLLKKMHSK